MYSESNNCTDSTNDIFEEWLQITEKFLSESIQALPSDSPNSRAIKASILLKWRAFFERSGVKWSVDTNCQYCFYPWWNGISNLEYKIEELIPRRNVGKNRKQIPNRHKKLKRKYVYQLAITCSICKKVNMINVNQKKNTSSSSRKLELNNYHQKPICMNKEEAVKPEIKEAYCIKENNGTKKNEGMNNNLQPQEGNEKNVGMEAEDIGLLEKKCLERSPSYKGMSDGQINEGKENDGQPEVIIEKRNSIGKFLSKSFQILPADTPSSRAIKAYILSKWSTLCIRNGVERSVKRNCQYCFNPWSNGLFNMKYVENKKARKERTLKFLLKRMKETKYSHVSQTQRNSASLAERKICRKLRKLATKAVPKLVITCSICKKRNKISVVSKNESSTSVKSTETNDHQESKCMKKKKKKIDPFAGLNPKYLKTKTKVAVFKSFAKTKNQEANYWEENNVSERNEGKNDNGQPKGDYEKNVGMEVEDIVLLEKKCFEQPPSNKGESGDKKNTGKKNNKQPKVANDKNVEMGATDLGLLQKKCCKQSTLDERAPGVNNTISKVKNGKIKKKKSKEKCIKGVIKKGVFAESDKKISSISNYFRNYFRKECS